MTSRRFDRLRSAIACTVPSPRLRAVLPGLLALAAAAELFAMFGPAAVNRRLALDATRVAAELEEEDGALRGRLHAIGEPATKSREMDPMALLREVRASSAHGTVDITRLVPRQNDPGIFDVELLASYPAFLDLVAGLERLGARLQGVRLRAAETAAQDRTAGAVRQSASFTLEVPRRIPMFPRTPTLQDPAAAAQSARDPFATPSGNDDLLPRRYVLTGLTRTANGPVATINDRDYTVGDRLGDLMIIAIGVTEVTLASGTRQTRLRFSRPAQAAPD